MPDYRIGEDDDIAGEGDEDGAGGDEIGAIVAAVRRVMRGKRGRGTSRSGMVRQVDTGARTPYGEPVLAHEPVIDASKWQTMGLGFVVVALAGAAQLVQPFLEAFTPGRLVLEQTAAGNLVNGIFIGVRPQIGNLAAMPVSAFGPGAFESRIKFDTGQPAIPFTINLITVAAAQTISGMAYGTVIKRA